MRFLQRKKTKLNKDSNKKDDHFDSYLALKQEAEHSLLIYVSTDRQTLYYELPHHPNLYFVVKKIAEVVIGYAQPLFCLSDAFFVSMFVK